MIAVSKVGVTVACLAVREFQRAKLTAKLGSNWTEARVGMYFSVVQSHEDNEAPLDEDVTVDGVQDYLTIGLKDAASYNLPGESGGLFIGVRSTGTISRLTAPGSGPGVVADDAASCSAVGYAGVTLVDGGVITGGPLLFPDPEPETGYNGFYCLKFLVNNRGAASQSVAVSVARSGLVDGSDYGKAALYQAINNASFGAGRAVAWNTGAAARALPDAAWVRIPFYNARLRIQEIMALKIST